MKDPQDAGKYQVDNDGPVQGQVVGSHNTIYQQWTMQCKHDPQGTTPSSPTKPQRVWNIPYLCNDYFTGRTEILEQLHARFKANNTTALSQHTAMCGLGGIGKTQIAVQYAYEHCDDYQSVLWARAESSEALTSSFVEIARLLDLPQKDEKDQTITVQAVKHWLQSSSGWLLILDNADEPVIVREFLPTKCAGHILLTTRAQALGGLAQRIDVDTFTSEFGALFLLRRATLIAADAAIDDAVQGDREVATKISEELGGLPLALDQAGAYIEETQCSLPDYQSLYRTRRAEVLKERGGIMGDHPDSVATTWSLSFQRVQERNAAAADLLRFCAFLHPDAIPEEIITAGAEHLGPLLQTIAHDTMALNKAIAALGGHSLIRRDPAEKILSVHRLVQAVLRDAMADDEAKVWAERAVRAMNAVFPDADPDADFVPWRVYERYLLHVLVCTDLVKQKQFTFLEAASLFYQTGKYLIGRAQYQEAEPLLLHALDIYKYLQGPNTATCLNGLAVLYKNQSKYELAEVRYQQVLEIYEQQLGPEHPSTAGCLNNLAVLCRTQGKYEQAELLSQRALAICEKALGPEHPHTARNLNNLAKLYCKQGKYDQAESLFQRALAIRKKWLGPEHPSTATSLDNLGRLYNAQGKYDQAEPLHQRALEIREQQLGLLHPDTAQSLNNLALLYQVQGKYEQAGPLCQRALAIYEKALGSQHPSTQQARQNYTALLRVIGRDEEAKQLEDTPTHDIPDTYLSSVVADETCLPDEQY